MKYKELPMICGSFYDKDEAIACAAYISKNGMPMPKKPEVIREEHWDHGGDYSDYTHRYTYTDRWALDFGSYIKEYSATAEKVRHAVDDFRAGYKALLIKVTKVELEVWKVTLAKNIKKLLKKYPTYEDLDQWSLISKVKELADEKVIERLDRILHDWTLPYDQQKPASSHIQKLIATEIAVLNDKRWKDHLDREDGRAM